MSIKFYIRYFIIKILISFHISITGNMYKIILIFILVSHTALSTNQEKTSKIKYPKKLFTLKMMNDCKKIKCPTKEDPVCVKIKYKSEFANNTLYIIMINKCEIEYTKCHQGLEAIVVPMKFCKHENISIDGKRRLKREIEVNLPRVSSSSSAEMEDYSEAVRVTRARRSQNGSSLPQTTKKLNETKLKIVTTIKPKVDQHKHRRYGIGPKKEAPVKLSMFDHASTEENSDDFDPFKKLKDIQTDGEQDTVNSDTQALVANKMEGILSDNSDKNVNKDDHNKPDEPESNASQRESAEELKDTHKPPGIKAITPSVTQLEGTENESDHNENEASNKEPEAACPTECPARDMMVCAKCQHGVYKTFSSICHMRLLSCQQPGEELELVSRYPCILSAPYLETENMQPKGRVSEPNDEDIVLKYIKCRQRANEAVPNMNIGHNGIPRIPVDCNFDNKTNLKVPNILLGE